MFYIELHVMDYFKLAMDMVKFYNVDYRIHETGEAVRIIVEGGEDLYLAELYFSGNWVAKSDMLCGMCIEAIEKSGNGDATCGHLVFTHPKQYNSLFE